MIDIKLLQPEVSDASEVLHLKLWEGTIFDYSLSGFAGTLSGGTGTPSSNPPGFNFIAANTQYIDIGTGPSVVKTISVWINVNNVSGIKTFITINANDSFWINNATVRVSGFAGHTIYVNGIAGTQGVDTIKASVWNHLVLTDATENDASNLDIGRKEGASSFDGLISDVRLYSTVRTAAQVRDFYEQTRWRYSV